MKPKKWAVILLVIVLTLSGASCLSGGDEAARFSLTLTPLSAAIRETATARVEGQGGASDELATAIVQATSQAEDIYATQTARAELNEPSRLATATAIAPVVAELPRYGVDIADGYVAWLHDPVSIELNGFNQQGFANDYPQITAADFVLAADIKWNTRNSMSGCGFMFRSNGDQNKPNQYMVIMTRVASGHLAFLATADGKIGNFREFFPKTTDQSFNWFNDATNRLIVVARGNLLEIYTNGILLTQIDTTLPPPDTVLAFPKIVIPENATPQEVQEYEDQIRQYADSINQITSQLNEAKVNFSSGKAVYTDGLLGFLGVSQSGQMRCEFSNAWLFILNK